MIYSFIIPGHIYSIRRQNNVDEVLDGEQAAVLGRITRTPVVRKVRTMQITVTTISEMGASLELVWYRMPYMKNNLKVGSIYIFYGKSQ